MTAEMIKNLTPGEVERAYYSYRGIADIYEELYGGPARASEFREYLIADRTCMALWRRMKELGID